MWWRLSSKELKLIFGSLFLTNSIKIMCKFWLLPLQCHTAISSISANWLSFNSDPGMARETPWEDSRLTLLNLSMHKKLKFYDTFWLFSCIYHNDNIDIIL